MYIYNEYIYIHIYIYISIRIIRMMRNIRMIPFVESMCRCRIQRRLRRMAPAMCER